MSISLASLATMTTGYTFRSKIEMSPGGTIAVVQMKDITSGNTVDCHNLTMVSDISVSDNHCVQKGDLIFQTRGLNLTSAIVNEDVKDTIVAAPLLRIRVNDTKQILPEYLNWYISQAPAQAYISICTSGTSSMMINKKAIGDMPIEVPSLEKQISVVELATLCSQEQDLLTQLKEKRHNLISASLLEFIK